VGGREGRGKRGTKKEEEKGKRNNNLFFSIRAPKLSPTQTR